MADTPVKETPVATPIEDGTEVDLDFKIEDLPDDASPEDTQKAIATLTAQKAHWRGKHDALVEAGSKPVEKPEEKKTEAKAETTELSQADLITLTRSDIAEEDIPEVLEFAKLKGVSVKEALESTVVQSILSTNKEARTVADATNVNKTAKTTAGTTDDELMANASKGIMPDSDEEMSRLARLRLGL